MVKSPKSDRELESTTARKGPKCLHRILEWAFGTSDDRSVDTEDDR